MYYPRQEEGYFRNIFSPFARLCNIFYSTGRVNLMSLCVFCKEGRIQGGEGDRPTEADQTSFFLKYIIKKIKKCNEIRSKSHILWYISGIWGIVRRANAGPWTPRNNTRASRSWCTFGALRPPPLTAISGSVLVCY